MTRWIMVFGTAVTLSAIGAGCAAPQDEGDRFREAIPNEGEVALKVPGGSQGATGTKSQGIRIATGGAAGETARYYGFTREITNGVDHGTAAILGGVWAIVHQTPTSIEPKKAVWGPGSATALEPVVWRFTVTEVGDSEYDYVLEGQPKAGGAWRSVLTGHGFGKSRPEHKTGTFTFDNDAVRELDPANAKDYGTTKVTYDLVKIPAVIDVELRPGDAKGWADVRVTHDVGGAGSVDITALGDLDDSKSTQLEDIRVLSRWTSVGSGRADIVMKNGDLPMTVNASECWSTSFARVYYKDTVDYEAPTGDATVCAFPASTL